jgi:hypothetical protein
VEDHTCEDAHTTAAVDLHHLGLAPYSFALLEWFFDSSASTHVIGNRALLTDVRPAPLSTITTANVNSLPIVAHGTAAIDKNKKVKQVMYVFCLRKNLLSVGKLVEEGHNMLCGSKRCWMLFRLNSHHIMLTAMQEGKNCLYKLSPSNPGRLSSPQFPHHPVFLATLKQTDVGHGTQDSSPAATLWHQRTSHLNYQSLYNLFHKKMVTEMPTLCLVQKTYDICIMGKQHRHLIPRISLTPTTRFHKLQWFILIFAALSLTNPLLVLDTFKLS